MVGEKLRDVDLNLLVVLHALLRCQNVSRAARELDMSQSAVSSALKRLRNLFDDPLFVRSREGMVPTPKARELFEPVSEIVRLARLALTPASQFDPTQSERTLICSLGDVGDMMILPLMVKHMRDEGIPIALKSLEITSEQAIPLLEDGRLDLYVGMIETASSEILCQKLYEDRLVALSSAESDIPDKVGFDQYVSYDHVAIQVRSPNPPRNSLFEMIRKSDVKRNVRVETPYIASVPAILGLNRNVIATMPMSLARSFQRRGNLRIAELDFLDATIVVNQYWHSRFKNDPFIVWARRLVHRLICNSDFDFA